MEAADVEDLVDQIYAANDSTGDGKILLMLNSDSFAGYASDFKESIFDQVEGIKQLEEEFFPHEDLVRWNMPMVKCQSSKNSGWRLRRQMLREFGDFRMDVCL